MSDARDDLLTTAEQAIATGDFVRARDLLERCIAGGGPPQAHHMLALLLHITDEQLEALHHWELAFSGLRASGEDLLAARVAIHLAGVTTSLGRQSAGLGWCENARALLDGLEDCPELGYLELAGYSCERTNQEELLAAGERALTIAARFGDRDLQVRALSDSGLALVTMGRAREGFARLDAAMAAISTGEFSFETAGLGFCAMLSACDRSADLARAQEWIVGAYALIGGADSPIKILGTHCRVVWGSVLCAVGRWDEAEDELQNALGARNHPQQAHRAINSVHLANLRIEQGRLEEAAVLLEPFEDWAISCAPLARLHLHKGELAPARAQLLRAIDELVGDKIRGAEALELLVVVELAFEDTAAASRAASALADLAGASDIDFLQALAATARARVLVATGDPHQALAQFNTAIRLLAEAERPYRLAEARSEMAELHAAQGDIAAAIAQARAALTCLERLGAKTARDRVAARLRSWGDHRRTGPRTTEALEVLSTREREVLALLQEGLSNAAIAERLFISPKTTEHHVGRILSKLGVRSRAQAAALAVQLQAAGHK